MTVLAFTDSPLGTAGNSAAGRASASNAKPSCRHCGAPLIDDHMRETGFCCAGCSYVHRLVCENGFESYYRIKDAVTAPADAAVFQPRDYAWLREAQTHAEDQCGPGAPTNGRSRHATGIPELTVDVQGISCAACVWLIERVFNQQPGAREAFVNAQYGTMRLRWVAGEFDAAAFAEVLQRFGYVIGPAGQTERDPESHALVRRIGLCAAFAMNVMLFSLPVYFGMQRSFEWASLFALLSLGFGTLSFLVGGTYFVGRAVQSLRQGAMHIDLPIALGIVGAYVGSLYGWIVGEERYVYFDFVSTFILLMLVGRWAQTAAVERNRRRLLSQQPTLQPVQLASGEAVTAERLRAGDVMVVRAGQTVVVEARLESEHAVMSLASINGEADPREFARGDRIPAGAVNVGRGEFRGTATQGWSDSLLAQLLQANQRPSARHAFLETVVRGYTVGILWVAVLSGLGWWLGTHDLMRTGAVVTAVLVVSCPCAIGLAYPLADEMATVALRRRGVFVREADLWPRLARIRQVVFDKTGTLTLERPVLVNRDALVRLDAPARSALLALVRDNPHPISECLQQELLALGRVDPLAGEVVETIGMGVELGAWSLGRAGWRVTTEPGGDAATGAVLAFDRNVVARFEFADRPRSDAAAELAALRRRGLDTYVLSGDRHEKVQLLATELGMPSANAIAEMTPSGKAQWVTSLGASSVMMLGDGANDSLAFDAAAVRGTPVIHRGVLERKADFYYLGRGIAGLRGLFEVDGIRRRTHRMILVFSVAYNALAVGLAVAGHMNPLIAAVLMPVNSLITLVLVTGRMRPAFRR
jgi:Cu2+-exporting ATPase